MYRYGLEYSLVIQNVQQSGSSTTSVVAPRSRWSARRTGKQVFGLREVLNDPLPTASYLIEGNVELLEVL